MDFLFSSVQLHYAINHNFIVYEIAQMGSQPKASYEKTEKLVKTTTYSGVQYYFFSNIATNSVAWNLDGLEYCISTDLPVSALEEIITSI